jgi:hypothetical protein
MYRMIGFALLLLRAGLVMHRYTGRIFVDPEESRAPSDLPP